MVINLMHKLLIAKKKPNNFRIISQQLKTNSVSFKSNNFNFNVSLLLNTTNLNITHTQTHARSHNRYIYKNIGILFIRHQVIQKKIRTLYN